MAKDSAIVTDPRILRGMTKAGLIEWNEHATDRHWTGREVRRIWVRPGAKLENEYDFTYRGKRYRLRYFDGCFHRFVCRAGVPGPAFV